MTARVRELLTDVLVIGSECAGACAALALEDTGLDVTVVTKGLHGGSGNSQLGAYSVNAALGHPDARDSPGEHFVDTVVSGCFVGNQDIIDRYVREAPEHVLRLRERGVRWDMRDGRIDCTRMPGCRFPRSLHIDYRTGFHLAKMLKRAVERSRNVRVLNYTLVTNFMREKGGSGVCGAFALDMRTGDLRVLRAKAIILATGGGSFMYRLHTGVHESTGDGYAYAYRAGAELSEMEFVQFFPAMVYPPSLEGLVGPCSPPRYWMGAAMYNSLGERFMHRYAPGELERATRDILCRAMFREILDGRASPHGGVWLDATHAAPNFIEEQVKRYCGGKWTWSGVNVLAYGLDPRKVAMEIAPAAHYFMGGLRIDTEARTNVAGLFAAGEAVTGMSGANRIAGNALSFALVSGAWAGRSAARYAGEREVPEANADFVREETERVARLMAGGDGDCGAHPVKMRKRLQEALWKDANVIRTAEGLDRAREVLRELRETPPGFKPSGIRFDRVLHEALTLDTMLEVGEMIVGAARLREETRGSHCREEFPERNDESWLKNLVIRKEGDRMTFTPREAVLTFLRPEGAPARTGPRQEPTR